MQGARRFLVRGARALGVEVIDRCNLTVLQEPGMEDLVAFLADNQVAHASGSHVLGYTPAPLQRPMLSCSYKHCSVDVPAWRGC